MDASSIEVGDWLVWRVGWGAQFKVVAATETHVWVDVGCNQRRAFSREDLRAFKVVQGER